MGRFGQGQSESGTGQGPPDRPGGVTRARMASSPLFLSQLPIFSGCRCGCRFSSGEGHHHPPSGGVPVQVGGSRSLWTRSSSLRARPNEVDGRVSHKEAWKPEPSGTPLPPARHDLIVSFARHNRSFPGLNGALRTAPAARRRRRTQDAQLRQVEEAQKLELDLDGRGLSSRAGPGSHRARAPPPRRRREVPGALRAALPSAARAPETSRARPPARLPRQPLRSRPRRPFWSGRSGRSGKRILLLLQAMTRPEPWPRASANKRSWSGWCWVCLETPCAGGLSCAPRSLFLTSGLLAAAGRLSLGVGPASRPLAWRCRGLLVCYCKLHPVYPAHYEVPSPAHPSLLPNGLDSRKILPSLGFTRRLS